MKNIFFLSILAFTISASAQSTSPRFSTSSLGDNTGRALTYSYSAPTFTATYKVKSNSYETIVRDSLTGAQTITADITRCNVADKLRIIFASDGSDRIVTFSTGFATTAAYTVTANTSTNIDFSFNGYAWSPQLSGNLTTGLSGDGTVGAPGIAFTSDPDNGFYRIGANHWAASVGGSKVVDYSTTGVSLTGTLSATGLMVPVIQRTSTTYTATGTYTVTAAQLAGGLLVAATSTAASTIVLPTTALMATQFNGTGGTSFDFCIDNSGASNGTVTIAVSTGMTASGFPSSNTLTLAGSATIGIACFRVTFISATASTLTRIN
jgi:hypothetical protein